MPGGNSGLGLRNVAKRVNRLIVLPYLVMYVRTGRAAGASDVSNLIAALDSLAGFDRNPREVPVAGGDPVAVIDDDEVAIARVRGRVDYQSIGSRLHRSTEVYCNVEAFVNLAPFAVERIAPHSEPVGHIPIDGQAPRDRGQTQDVGMQAVIDMTHFALEVVGSFVQRHDGLGSADTDQFIGLGRVLHLSVSSQLLRHIFDVRDLPFQLRV